MNTDKINAEKNVTIKKKMRNERKGSNTSFETETKRKQEMKGLDNLGNPVQSSESDRSKTVRIQQYLKDCLLQSSPHVAIISQHS